MNLICKEEHSINKNYNKWKQWSVHKIDGFMKIFANKEKLMNSKSENKEVDNMKKEDKGEIKCSKNNKEGLPFLNNF